MAHLLVVEDDEAIMKMLVRILESKGHRVRCAHDGEEGLSFVADEAPDALILDLDLPKVHGHEVCRRLKADPATRHIPVMMLTAAYTSVTDSLRGARLGADEYVLKPFFPAALLVTIDRMLAAHTS